MKYNINYFTKNDIKKIESAMSENNYNVIAESSSRAIAGFSLGGRQTLAAGLGHPDIFNYVCTFSPAIFENPQINEFEA